MALGLAEMRRETLKERAFVASLQPKVSSHPELIKSGAPLDRIREFLRDDAGQPLEQVALHDAWFKHIAQAHAEGKHAGIMSPFGFGKTWMIVLGLILDSIGMRPNRRNQIVSLNDPIAISRSDAVREAIERLASWQAMFPGVVPDKDRWRKQAFTVLRSANVISTDPTVGAYGILSSRIGTRSDFTVFDDVDDDTSLSAPIREKKRARFNKQWMSRLEPGHKAVFVATRWHEEDVASSKVTNPKWSWLVGAVSEDFEYLEVTRTGAPFEESPWPEVVPRTKYVSELHERQGCAVYRLPLWPGKFDAEELRSRCVDMGERAFNLGYRQDALSDHEKTFPSFEQCVRFGLDRHAIPCAFHVITVDLSTTKRPGNWISVWGVTADGQKILKELRRGAWKSPETLRHMAELQLKYDAVRVLVETNAYQESLLSWANEPEIRRKYPSLWPKLKAHDTQGNTKSDLEIGVPGLELEFENQSILIAPEERCELGCDCTWCEYRYQFIGYPHHKEFDAVMVTWFGMIAVGQILKKRRGRAKPTREAIEDRKRKKLEQLERARRKRQGRAGSGEGEGQEERERALRELLERHARVAITGPPKCGATTLSRIVTDRRVIHTEAFKGLAWAKVPQAVVDEIGDRERFVVEGVQVPRALKRGLEVDCVVLLREPLEDLDARQAALGRQVIKGLSNVAVIEL